MSTVKMHADEVDTDIHLVRRLLKAQFPQWVDLPLAPVESAGTDNAIYRLGDNMAVRLPRIDWAVGQVEKEYEWLPKLAPHLPLPVPVPLAKGEPGEGYPWYWSIYRWLEGKNMTITDIPNRRQAAMDLAQFITALQRIDPEGGPLAADHGLRGRPLRTRDTDTREAIAALHGLVDADKATKIWEKALQVPDWDLAPVWFHGDLLPGNVLFHQGRINAIIDLGELGVGDPACDLMIAWGMFSGESRDIFRTALQVDDTTWARGRGFALSQALIFIPYYLNTNPLGVNHALRTIDEIFAEY